MSDDFFSADESGDAATFEANEALIRSRKRRRTKVIALVALGSVGALGIYSCASSQTDDTWQGADSGQVVDGTGVNGTATQADGTPVASDEWFFRVKHFLHCRSTTISVHKHW